MGWGHTVGASWSKQIPDSNEVAQYLELTSTKSQLHRSRSYEREILPSAASFLCLEGSRWQWLRLCSCHCQARRGRGQLLKSPFGMCRGEGAGDTRFLQAPFCSEADLTWTSFPATPGGLFNYTTEGGFLRLLASILKCPSTSLVGSQFRSCRPYTAEGHHRHILLQSLKEKESRSKYFNTLAAF